MNLREVALFAALDDVALAAVDAHISWREVHGGDLLVEQGEEADAAYVIAAGRFEVTRRDGNGDVAYVGGLGPGDLVGEVAALSGRPRTASVRAVRDGTVGKLPADAFSALLDETPRLGGAVARVLASRAAGHDLMPVSPAPKILVVLPLDGSDAGRAFAPAFAAAFEAQSLHVEEVTAARMDAALGPGASALDRGDLGSDLALRWLHDLEHDADVVLLFADPTGTPWTKNCLRQADRVVLVADAAGDPTRRAVELLVDQDRPPFAQLVLLQPQVVVSASGTAAWLSERGGMPHHHVREANPFDVARASRLVCERGIGLALSGASSRAPAHLGVLRAMNELGIPIDCVSGTSSGAAVAAQIALGLPHADALDQAIRVATTVGLGPMELQPPLTSLSSGASLELLLREGRGDELLEDQFVGAFLHAVDLSRHQLVRISSGPVWRGVRASMGLPGIFPPVAIDEQLLVDGGVMSMLPMEALYPQCHRGLVVGCDMDPAGYRKERSMSAVEPYGATLSGWDQLFRTWMPGLAPARAPKIGQVLLNALCIPSYEARKQLLEVEKHKNVCVIRPTVGRYGMFDVDEAAARALEQQTYVASLEALADVHAQAGGIGTVW